MSRRAWLVKGLVCLAVLAAALPPLALAQDDPCAGLPPSRLEVGGVGRSILGIPLNVRAQPATEAEQIGEIAPGGTFTVLEGPVCASGVRRWRVESGDLVGWVAESVAQDYYVEPAQAPADPPMTAEAVEAAEPLWEPIRAANADQVVELALLEPEAETVSDLAWSPFGVMLAVAVPAGVWAYNPDLLGDPLALVAYEADAPQASGPLTAIAFNADGTLLATGTAGGALLLWDVETGEQVRALPTAPEGGPLVGVAFGPAPAGLEVEGALLVAAAEDGALYRFGGESHAPLPALTMPSESITALALSADGSLLAAAGADGAVLLWDVTTGGEIASLPGPVASPAAVAFSPDGRWLAVAGCADAACAEGEVRLWPLPLEAAPDDAARALRGHAAGVTALAFSPAPDGADAALLASGGADGAVILWDVEDAGPLAVLQGHQGALRGLAFSLDGSRLASGDAEGAVRLWGLPPG